MTIIVIMYSCSPSEKKTEDKFTASEIIEDLTIANRYKEARDLKNALIQCDKVEEKIDNKKIRGLTSYYLDFCKKS